MDPVHLLGIEFRGVSHVIWFAISMAILAFSALWFPVLAYRAKRTDSEDKRTTFTAAAVTPLMLMTVWHGFTAIAALLFTGFGTIDGNVYSVDCIWFNGTLAALYAATSYAYLKGVTRMLKELISYVTGIPFKKTFKYGYLRNPFDSIQRFEISAYSQEEADDLAKAKVSAMFEKQETVMLDFFCFESV